MKVSQLDQIRQAYEEGVCTVQSIRQRLDIMKDVRFGLLNKKRYSDGVVLETYGYASSNGTIGSRNKKNRYST
jgi:hypothetical protein